MKLFVVIPQTMTMIVVNNEINDTFIHFQKSFQRSISFLTWKQNL
jgi:hypothetical protein